MELYKVNFDQILALDEQHLALLAALTCERIGPNYSRFSQEAQWGSVEDLAKGIEFIYTAASAGIWSQNDAEKVQVAVEKLVPDLDEFVEYPMVGYAFDAALAVDAALGFLATGDKQQVVDCVTHALNTVDMFVQELNDLHPNRADLNQVIDQSQYMQRESQRQQNLVVLLTETQVITPELVAELRQKQKLAEAMISLNLLPT